jgi:hypothetical protein
VRDDFETLLRGFREGSLESRIGYSIGMLLIAFAFFTLFRSSINRIFRRAKSLQHESISDCPPRNIREGVVMSEGKAWRVCITVWVLNSVPHSSGLPPDGSRPIRPFKQRLAL